MSVTPLAQSFGPQYVGSTVFVDGLVGSDVTGQRNRSDLPFQTIQAANRASQWGDLVWIGYGKGYYTDAANVACMGGRAYHADPMVLLSDPRLNAPPIYFADLQMGSSSNQAISPTLNSYPTTLLMDRELVVVGQSTSGSAFVAQRFKIHSITSGVITLNAPFSGYSLGTLGGVGYISPGPMWTTPQLNGQFDGLIQGQRFNDNELNGVGILKQSGGATVTTAGQSVATAEPDTFADGATTWLQSPLANTALGSSPVDVTWSGPLSAGSGGSVVAASNNSNLGVVLSTTASKGTCTMIFTTRFQGPLLASSGNICGMDVLGTECYAAWNFVLGGPYTLNLYSGSGSPFALTITTPADVNAYALMQELSSGSDSSSLYVGNTGTFSLQNNNTNSSPASSAANFMVGWDSNLTLDHVEVGHYLFFDGAISQLKIFAWLNAMLQDYGLY